MFEVNIRSAPDPGVITITWSQPLYSVEDLERDPSQTFAAAMEALPGVEVVVMRRYSADVRFARHVVDLYAMVRALESLWLNEFTAWLPGDIRVHADCGCT